ncbi:MAG: SBBP repeat-containing protein [Flavobacteriales bacterium]|nr:SBBP repeat-containing protein [Flavobacteriales bacterium]
MHTLFSSERSATRPCNTPPAGRWAFWLSLLLFPGQWLTAQPVLQWAKGSFTNTTGSCTPMEIEVDAHGYVYLTGHFTGTVDMDPDAGVTTLTSTNVFPDIFFAKYSSAGALVYAHAMGGPGSDFGYSIAVDANSNVYITGGFEGTVDFDPGTGTLNHVSGGEWDIFLAKYDPNGDLRWSKGIGGSQADNGESIAIDAANDVYLTGYFRSTVNFNPGGVAKPMSSAGLDDAFLVKYDRNGNYVYRARLGGVNADYGTAVSVDAAMNAYITGSFHYNVVPGSGLPNLVSAGQYDVFFAKYNPAGTILYAKRAGGTENDVGNGLAIDAAGQVHLSGHFEGTADMDPGAAVFNLTSHAGNRDVFLAKYGSAGNFLWADGLGGTNNNQGEDLTLDADGNAYLIGGFKGTTDFDPGAGTFSRSAIGSTFQDLYFALFDATGALRSAFGDPGAYALGSGAEEYGKSIAVDADGIIYVAGYFTGTVDFDLGPGVTSLPTAGFQNGFWAKYAACLIGGICDDGDANTVNDVYGTDCVCAGKPPATECLELVTRADAFGGENTWEIKDQNGTPQATGGPYLVGAGTTVTESVCLPPGCYDLCMFDAGGDGMSALLTGGYLLRDADGWRIVDNEDDGVFQSTSCACPSPGFCLPLGTDRVIVSHCDKENWAVNDVIIARENPLVSAGWGSPNPADDGYQFIFFDPDGSYCRRVLRTHTTSNGNGPADALRATKLVLNWSTLPLPPDILLNVRVRSLVNGTFSDFGPACRFRLLSATNPCPVPKLISTGIENSCNVSRTMNGTDRLYATNASATLYQFRFSYDDGIKSCIRRITTNTRILTLSANPLPGEELLCGTFTYSVRVRVSQDNGYSWCPYGDHCLVTISSGNAPCVQRAPTGTLPEVNESSPPPPTIPEVTLWPNPNDGSLLSISITNLTQEVDHIGFELYDALGRKRMTWGTATDDGTAKGTIPLSPKLPPGFYVANISAGGQNFTRRLVVR